MDVNLSFSRESFVRLIKYRMMDQFRPITKPLEYPVGIFNWIDGMTLLDIRLQRVVDGSVVALNALSSDGKVRQVPERFSFNGTAITLDLSLTVYLAKLADVAAAGLSQPPVSQLPVLNGFLIITARLGVGEDGIPHLSLVLDTSRLSGLGLPPDVVSGLSSAASDDLAFDIAAALRDVLPPGSGRVLNAGLTLDDDQNVLLRFEFPDSTPRLAADRLREWQAFAQTPPPANLSGQDWAVDLDGMTVAALIAQKAGPYFKDKPPVYFDPSWIDYSFSNGSPPRAVVKKLGRIDNACAGNDVRFDAFVNVDFSVPPPGDVLRGTMSFDLNENDWDVAKCFGLELLNPLGIFITLFDQGEIGLGLGSLGLSLDMPLRPVLALAALVMLIIGEDKAIAQGFINDQLDKEPTVTKLPGGGYAIDQAISLDNNLTRNWLHLLQAEGAGGRMFLRGALKVPDPILPRLEGSDLEGFSPWHLADRCNPSSGQTTKASLRLSLGLGYGADQAAPPHPMPTISIHYARRPDGGDLTYEILNDPLGIYQDPYSEYTQLYFPDIPGLIEAQLKSETVRKNRFQSFAKMPYGLRLRLYTNGGVREYEFAAPPVFQEYVETLAQAAERINHCEQLGHDLVLKKYLELLWRVDPLVDAFGAQRWELNLIGLESGRQARVWNQETGALLGEFSADRFGRLDINLVIAADEFAPSILLTLDDVPYLDRQQLRQVQTTHIPASDEPVIQLLTRQTLLTELDQLDFSEPLETVEFTVSAGRPLLLARTQADALRVHALPLSYAPGLALPVTSSHTSQLDEPAAPRFRLLSYAPTQSAEPGGYSARSALPLGASSGDLLVHVSLGGRRLTVYRAGPAQEYSGQQWNESPAGDEA
jgi:hypothetical protein